MDEYTKQALRLLGTYTAGSFDIWALAGSAKASCRAHILTVFCNKQVPQKYAGVNALRDTFYKAMNITGETPNEREKQFVALAKDVTSKNPLSDPHSREFRESANNTLSKLGF